MSFIFLIESANSAMDLFFKPAEESPFHLDGRSRKASITNMKGPGVTSPTKSDIEQDKGKCLSVVHGSSLPRIAVILEISTRIW